MKKRHLMTFIVLALLLAACSVATPVAPASTPTPPAAMDTPVPTWTPAPTPTLTPVPPMRVTLKWPAAVSPVELPRIDVIIQPPADTNPPVLAYAEILDPDSNSVGTWELRREDAYHYRSEDPLRLGLEPTPGTWWLIVRINTSLDLVGARVMPFTIAEVPYANLIGWVPEGLTHKVPEAFSDAGGGGNLTAGWRTWHSPEGRGELSLYWAPGPAEALSLTHAVAMLEATYGDDVPDIEDVIEIEWDDSIAYQFTERWRGDIYSTAYVFQGADWMLYCVRARPLVERQSSQLLMDVAKAFLP